VAAIFKKKLCYSQEPRDALRQVK